MRGTGRTIFILCFAGLLACSGSGGGFSSSEGEFVPQSETHYVYTANSGDDSVGVFSLEISNLATNGALTSLGTAATGVGSQPKALAMHPTKKFLFVADYGTDQVSTFSIDSSTGALTLVGHTSTGDKPSSLAVSPNGSFLFVHLEGNMATKTFSIDTTTGVLTNGPLYSSYGASTYPVSSVFDSTGVFFVATSDYLHAYTINGTGSMISTGLSTSSTLRSLKFAPGEAFLSGVDTSSNKIYTFPVTAANADPVGTGVSTTTASASPSSSLTYASTGKFLFVTNHADDALQGFSVNATTGVLTNAGTTAMPAGCAPKAASFDPTESYLVAACSDASGTLVSYTVHSATGALTQKDLKSISGAAIADVLAVEF